MYVVWISDPFIAKQGTSPARGHFRKKKLLLVHCCGSFLSLFPDTPNGACVLFVVKSVPVGFLNVNPHRPIKNTARRKNTSRSSAIQTWMSQESKGLRGFWEIAATHPGLCNTCCVNASTVCKCPVAPGQNAGSWSWRQGWEKPYDHNALEVMKISPFLLWNALREYVLICSF